MAAVPVLPMRVRQGYQNGIEYRLVQFADPKSRRWTYYLQSRIDGCAWGDVVEMELMP